MKISMGNDAEDFHIIYNINIAEWREKLNGADAAKFDKDIDFIEGTFEVRFMDAMLGGWCELIPFWLHQLLDSLWCLKEESDYCAFWYIETPNVWMSFQRISEEKIAVKKVVILDEERLKTVNRFLYCSDEMLKTNILDPESQNPGFIITEEKLTKMVLTVAKKFLLDLEAINPELMETGRYKNIRKKMKRLLDCSNES